MARNFLLFVYAMVPTLNDAATGIGGGVHIDGVGRVSSLRRRTVVWHH